jgi:hypothetical protein
MEKDPVDTFSDALFLVGMLASVFLVLLPDPPRPRPLTRCCCGGPVGPTGNDVLDEAWRKARE